MRVIYEMARFGVMLVILAAFSSATEMEFQVNLRYPDEKDSFQKEAEAVTFGVLIEIGYYRRGPLLEYLSQENRISRRGIGLFAASGRSGVSALEGNQINSFTRVVSPNPRALRLRDNIEEEVTLVAMVRIKGHREVFPYKGEEIIVDIDRVEDGQPIDVDVQLTVDEDLLPRKSGEVTFRILSPVSDQPLAGWLILRRPQLNLGRRTDEKGEIDLYIDNLEKDLVFSHRPGGDMPPQYDFHRPMGINKAISSEDLLHAFESGETITLYADKPLLAFRYVIEQDGERQPFTGNGRIVYSLDYGQPRYARRAHSVPVGNGVSAIYPGSLGVPAGSRFDDDQVEGSVIEELRSVIVDSYHFDDQIVMRFDKVDFIDVFTDDARPPYVVDVEVERVNEARSYAVAVLDSESGQPIWDWEASFHPRHGQDSDEWDVRKSPRGEMYLYNLPWQRVVVHVQAEGYADQELIIGANGFEGGSVRMTPLNRVHLFFAAELPVADAVVMYLLDPDNVSSLNELSGTIVDAEDGDHRVLQIESAASFPRTDQAVVVLLNAQNELVALDQVQLSAQRLIEQHIQGVVEPTVFEVSLETTHERAVNYYALDRETGLPLHFEQPGNTSGLMETGDLIEAAPLNLRWLGRAIDVYCYHPEDQRVALVHSIEEEPDADIQVRVDLDAESLQWHDRIPSHWHAVIEWWR